jgi:O-acetyl-ADP-ribose deacetylase (regulator of RNase III)
MKVLIGDLFDSSVQTLVNTVNCVGIMGRGVALEFKRHFPDMYKDYVQRCQLKEVRLGQPYLYRRATVPWILNFPTKDHWKSVSKLSDIVEGIEYLKQHYKSWGITSLAFPPLGCGLGQLEWRVVGPTLYRRLREFDIPIEMYAPFGTPHKELEPEFLESEGLFAARNAPGSKVSSSALALVEILARIEQEPYHWPIGRILFQKLAYFATEAGIPTGLEYKRGSFGPFAHDLRRLITKLVNNGLIHEQRLGKMFAVRVGPTYPDARVAFENDLSSLESKVDRVTDLVVRMRSEQAEIAATVHFAAQELAKKGSKKPSEKDVLAEVMEWKSMRTPPIKESRVAAAIRNLAILGWLDIEPSPNLSGMESSPAVV